MVQVCGFGHEGLFAGTRSSWPVGDTGDRLHRGRGLKGRQGNGLMCAASTIRCRRAPRESVSRFRCRLLVAVETAGVAGPGHDVGPRPDAPGRELGDRCREVGVAGRASWSMRWVVRPSMAATSATPTRSRLTP